MTKKDSPRMRKVNEILREAIADECQNLKDPRIGFLTITGVETAPDLRNATVFYSVLGENAAEAADALESASSRIRAAVGAQVRMKYVPKLTFSVDPSIEYGQRIAKILQSIELDPPDADSHNPGSMDADPPDAEATDGAGSAAVPDHASPDNPGPKEEADGRET